MFKRGNNTATEGKRKEQVGEVKWNESVCAGIQLASSSASGLLLATVGIDGSFLFS